MSWVTAIWSAAAGACLTVGAVHFIVWLKSRGSWSNLLFAIAATAGAATAMIELALMRAQTPAQYVVLLANMHVTVGVLVVSLVWFVRVHLSAGRLWLAWLVLGSRVVIVLLAFGIYPESNFSNFTSLHPISFLGETVEVAIGDRAPFSYIGHLSGILFLVFVLDASLSAWRRGDRRRSRAVAVVFGLAIVAGLTTGLLLNEGTLSVPYTVSFPFLIIIAGIAYELSVEVVRAGQLARTVRDNEERMRLATEATNLGVWEWDIVRDEIWVTDPIRSRIGFAREERPSLEQFLQTVHPDDREETRKAVQQALQGRGKFQTEYRSMNTTGEHRWIVASGQVVQGNNGKPDRIRGISVDITQRKQAEAEVQRQRAELAHISRVATMGQLSSALAHELNQPLGAILSNAEAAEMLLEANPPSLEQVSEILADIRKDDERAGEVIQRMRMFLRKQELEAVPLDIGEVVRDTLRLAGGDAVLRKAIVRAEVDTRPLPARGDPVQLQQVILNLLVNGMEAVAGNGPEERRVIVQAGRNHTGQIEVAVSDTGPGIPADQLDHLFEPFFTTKPNGMGMGTSIARTIVRAHHGRIWAENNPDGGVTFRFTLPIDERPESSQNASIPTSVEGPRPVKP